MIDTDAYSARLRAKAVRSEDGTLLVANFVGSGQADDLTDPPNCGGVGRVRHFHRATTDGWPSNPLPIDPALAFLAQERADDMTAQVFQNAACNWRCWYCYVPFDLLAGKEELGSWVSAKELVQCYVEVADRPPMIDLTGGQPDLAPEWVPWMMRALIDARLDESVYLWSDDNLSNDYFWQHLTAADHELISEYKGYGRVCCFKGFDAASFAFNTEASPDLFDRQFELFERLHSFGLDLYGYTTFTAPSDDGLSNAMRNFVDRLQRISEAMPLRVIPLEITEYGPVSHRLNDDRRASMEIQWRAIEAWENELERRFTTKEREVPIHQVSVRL